MVLTYLRLYIAGHPDAVAGMYSENSVLTQEEKHKIFEHQKEKKLLQGQSRAAYRVAATRKGMSLVTMPLVTITLFTLPLAMSLVRRTVWP